MTLRASGAASALAWLALAAFCWMVRPVVTPVLIAALFAVVLAPLTARLATWLGRRARLAPALVTLGASGILFGPIMAAGAVWALGYQGRCRPGA